MAEPLLVGGRCHDEELEGLSGYLQNGATQYEGHLNQQMISNHGDYKP